MLVGYMRVSSESDRQITDLQGVPKIVEAQEHLLCPAQHAQAASRSFAPCVVVVNCPLA
jgi:hypothetical protein